MNAPLNDILYLFDQVSELGIDMFVHCYDSTYRVICVYASLLLPACCMVSFYLSSVGYIPKLKRKVWRQRGSEQAQEI